MFRRRLASIASQIRDQAASWLALVGQVCALVGLPMPAVQAKDLSQPFPCQHRVCGCMKAADCWKNCCCFSAGDRIAWAQGHGVIPPDSLIEEAKHEGNASTTGKTCCSSKQTGVVKKQTASAQPSHVRWLSTIQARHCQGGFGDDGGAMPGCPPTQPVRWCFAWIADSDVPLSVESPVLLSSLPLLPPPRS